MLTLAGRRSAEVSRTPAWLPIGRRCAWGGPPLHGPEQSIAKKPESDTDNTALPGNPRALGPATASVTEVFATGSSSDPRHPGRVSGQIVPNEHAPLRHTPGIEG